MKSAKNIQDKLFSRGTDAGQNGTRAATPPTSGNSTNSGSNEGPPLSIKIPPPKPPNFPKDKSPGAESKKMPRRSGGTTESKPYETYQQRLLNKLGTKYDGVERYRQEQDEKRERHWKRWGPYLSERQWVRATVLAKIAFDESG